MFPPFFVAVSVIRRFFPVDRILPKTGYVIEQFLDELRTDP